MALEAVTPRQPGQRTLPDRTGQQGQRAAASSSSRAGCTQGPRPRLRGPWALIFTVLGVLLLVSSRRESWLQKALLVARKRPGRAWLGKSRQDPPGQVQFAACWWGALEECGSLASTCCLEDLAPWSPGPSEHQIVISFLSFPFSLCIPSSLFSLSCYFALHVSSKTCPL